MRGIIQRLHIFCTQRSSRMMQERKVATTLGPGVGEDHDPGEQALNYETESTIIDQNSS